MAMKKPFSLLLRTLTESPLYLISLSLFHIVHDQPVNPNHNDPHSPINPSPSGDLCSLRNPSLNDNRGPDLDCGEWTIRSGLRRWFEAVVWLSRKQGASGTRRWTGGGVSGAQRWAGNGAIGARHWANGGASGTRCWAGTVRLGLAPFLPWVAHSQTGCWGLYHYVGFREEMCAGIGYLLWREIMMW